MRAAKNESGMVRIQLTKQEVDLLNTEAYDVIEDGDRILVTPNGRFKGTSDHNLSETHTICVTKIWQDRKPFRMTDLTQIRTTAKGIEGELPPTLSAPVKRKPRSDKRVKIVLRPLVKSRMRELLDELNARLKDEPSLIYYVDDEGRVRARIEF